MTSLWTTLAGWLLLAVGALVIVATLLPFFRKGYWWIRLFDFPRLQIAVTGATVALLSLLLVPLDLSHGLFLGALLASVAYQAACIGPYTPIARQQVLDADPAGDAAPLRLLIANVLMDNRQSQRFLRIVDEADPDLVLVMETDQWWAESLSPIKDRYAFRLEQPQDNTYGMLLYSRLELMNACCRFIVDPDVPSFFAQVKLPQGDVIDLYALHPEPPQTFNDTFERDAELLIVGREVRRRVRPTVVCGDLNDVAWSSTTRLFQRTSGLLDPRRGRGLYSSFNAKNPLFRWPLDHVFLSKEFQVSSLKRLGYFGSDHFPVYVELQYRPEVSHHQTPPSPQPGDHQEVQEKISEVQG